jgi:hypothetical protein
VEPGKSLSMLIGEVDKQFSMFISNKSGLSYLATNDDGK